ncbi:hypothetical protein TrLO_g1297 [Triparma laevis f. longispina]|uniref:Uncharacterized protein n=1 Tax=Triparma laevis f. longispina TaxID=1714387 RepID=A0A9W7FCB6_9STRA|nr:hypothetical protein TrLO_g1297 [Triparma laevis f. longispina]
MIVHGGADCVFSWFGEDEEEQEEFVRRTAFDERQKERHVLATRVNFLLNVTKVGENAFSYAVNLVVVDFPDGVERIGNDAFFGCTSLTTVSFPTMLTAIGEYAFHYCISLENVDLLHTNFQELGEGVVTECENLKSMTIPDSLQTLGGEVIRGSSKLVPSNVAVWEEYTVVAYLRSQQNN